MNVNENLDQKYLNKIENINFQPVFILGIPRSGTSILYKILAKTNSFNSVTSYHIICYNELLNNHINNLEDEAKTKLNESFKEKGLVDRGMDRLKVYADFPEEYGYILGKITRQIYIHPKNIHLFSEMARKIQFISDINKPLLLKNPFDFQNIAYIKKEFPNAKFIFICRNPIKILSSNMKAIQVLLKNKHPYSIQIFRQYTKIFKNPLLLFPVKLFFLYIPVFGLIYLCNLYKRFTNRFIRDIVHLNSEDFTIINYEDLCENPNKSINGLMEFLKIKPEKKLDYEQFIQPRKTHFDEYIIKMKRFIQKKLKKYYDFFGYKID